MLGAMPNPNDPAIPGTAPDFEDVYDWTYQAGYGITSAAPGPYPRQDCAHDGHPVDMTSNPVSGDWVYPAVGSGLLIYNPQTSPVTVSLPLDDVDAVEPAGSHTVTIPGQVQQITGDTIFDEAGLPLQDEAGVELQDEAGGAVYTGGWALLPVPPQVYGYEPVPIIFDGIPDVAYIQFR
jgi:hypothetical protein